MTTGLPRGFVRVPYIKRRTRLDLFGGCQHRNFDERGSCTNCSYNLWTSIRLQIKELEEHGPQLSQEERVDRVVAILTASASDFDGLRYQGRKPRLPRRLRPAGTGSQRKSRMIQAAIKAGEAAAEREGNAMLLIVQNVGQLEAAGLDVMKIDQLREEVRAFLDTYIYRFNFNLEEGELWPLILAYAAHIGAISSEEILQNCVLDIDEKRERFRWWHEHARISEETLGGYAKMRYER